MIYFIQNKIPIINFGMQALVCKEIVKKYPQTTSRIDRLAWFIVDKIIRNEFITFAYSQSISFIHISAKIGDGIIVYGSPKSKYYQINMREKYYVDYFNRKNYIKNYISWRDETNIPVKNEEDLENFELPEAEDFYTPLMLKFAKLHYPKHFYLGMITGPYESGHAMRGMVELLQDFYKNQHFAKKILDKVTEIGIETGKVLIENGADGILIGDDYGTQETLQMSPRIWKKFILANLKRQVRIFRNRGAYVFLHSCGNIEAILDILVNECKFDVIHPLQPTAMNALKIIEEYKDKFVPMTGLEVQNSLPRKKPEEIKEEVRRFIEASGGRIIIAPTNSITNETPAENIMSGIKAAEEYKTT